MITRYDDLPLDEDLHFIVESNHLFKASSKYGKQIYVLDVIKYLERVWFKRKRASGTVLYGSSDETQIRDYFNAMTISGLQTYLMYDQPTEDGRDRCFHAEEDLDRLFVDADFKEGSTVCLVGFHHKKFSPVYEAWHQKYNINTAAFTTKSHSGGLISIPREFKENGWTKGRFILDNHIDNILKEFKVQRSLENK